MKDIETFKSMYDEINKNFNKLLKKRKKIEEKVFFVAVCGVHLGFEAKACIEVLKEENEWQNLPRDLSDCLESVAKLSLTSKEKELLENHTSSELH